MSTANAGDHPTLGGSPQTAGVTDRIDAPWAWKLPSGDIRRSLLLVTAFSILYFTVTAIRATEKPFWFDELGTLYIVRLPSFAASWQSVLHGIDFNPPLFYLIQRADRALFGEGLIAMRLPSMLGFWTLSVCLFRFAARQVGHIGGWIAMCIPSLTGAYYYAYEARPHGIVLGFCGLVLVCWQNSEEERRTRRLWLVGFSLFLGAAFFTHCYAVMIAIPFGIAELSQPLRGKKIRASGMVSLALPGIAAVICYIPLIDSYRRIVGGTEFISLFAARTSDLIAFYTYLISPCLLIVLVVLALVAVEQLRWRASAPSLFGLGKRRAPDALVTLCFLAIPCFALGIARLTRGPFIPRYFLVGVVGLAVVLAVATAALSKRSSLAVSALVTAALCLDGGQVIERRLQGSGAWVTEPSSGFVLGELGNPLAPFPLIARAPQSKVPIVVADALEFVYLTHYALSRRPQLYYISASKQELFPRLFVRLRQWCHVDFNAEETSDDFLRQHSDFVVYGNNAYHEWLYGLVSKGAEIRSMKFGERGRFLATMHVKVSEP